MQTPAFLGAGEAYVLRHTLQRSVITTPFDLSSNGLNNEPPILGMRHKKTMPEILLKSMSLKCLLSPWRRQF